MSGGIYSVACSFDLFISGFWSWQPYIIFSISVCPSFFLMFIGTSFRRIAFLRRKK
jgi:hypothetical protein